MSFRPFVLACFLSLCSLSSAVAQNDWSHTLVNPQVFIENLGQYDALEQGFSDEARYVIDHGFGWQVLVGDHGLHYLIQRMERSLPSEEGEHAEEGPKGEIHTSRISMEFVGASPQAQIEVTGQQADYYTYAYQQDENFIPVDRAHAFERVQYRNLYTGIDAEVVGKAEGGIKYSFHVAAGADAGQIALKWKGAQPTLDADGDVHLSAVLGELVDHRPTAWYADNPAEHIPVHFDLQGQEVRFVLGSYDPQRAIVIDPWTINPALPAPFNRAYEVDSDGAGNVYVWGGGMGYNCKKYNAAGTLQWTHVSPWDTSNAWFGELLVLAAGDVFITSGSVAKLRRLTTAGATTFTNNGPFFNNDEYWTLVLSCDNTRLISGGTRLSGFSPQGHLFNINMANGNQMAGSPINVSPVSMNEIRALCTGGNGNYYMFSNNNLIAVNQAFGIIYSIASGTSHPYNAPAYKCVNVQGQNSIDANTTHIYLNIGSTLQKRDINTGALVSSIAIPGGGFTGGFFGTGATNSGMVIDACDNVYVGSTNAIYKYDANLVLQGSVATTGAIYDLHIAPGGVLLAGGNALAISNTSLAPCAPKPISCVILPLELSFFQGECVDGLAKLNWATTKETEMGRFEVERTVDGANWVVAGQVAAVGNSTEIQEYRFEEPIPSGFPNGTGYYRLKMVDRNGTFHHSAVATLEGCGSLENQVKVSPNITAGSTELQFSAAAEGSGKLVVVDLMGKAVKSVNVQWAVGVNVVPVSLEGLAAGTYLLSVIDVKGAAVVRNARVVKQ